jgi:hypothetical protein
LLVRQDLKWFIIHKVRKYKEYNSECPLVGIGTLPPPLSLASVPLPPEPRGGGHTRLRVRGWGSPNSYDWRKSLALCLLCRFILHLFPSITRVLGPAHVLPRGNFTLGSISGSATPPLVSGSPPDLRDFSSYSPPNLGLIHFSI